MSYGNIKKRSPRTIVLSVILALCMALFGGSVLNLHLSADDYVSTANTTFKRNITINASRGQIVDCFGRPLAYNTDSYYVTFDRAFINMNNINGIIGELFGILTANGEKWVDLMPVTESEPYEFIDVTKLNEKNDTVPGTDNEISEDVYVEDEDKLDEKSVEKMISILGLNYYATCENCIDEMTEKYGLEKYSKELRRQIMGVRYTMEYLDFTVSNPYVFAKNVGEKTMSIIKENSEFFKGVDIRAAYNRAYDVAYCANIIGTTGPVYAEEWENLSKLGYSYDDLTGKTGIELSMESYLHGTNGVRTLVTDTNGNTISNDITTPAVNGATLMLTIDKDLQKVAYTSLANRIKLLQNGKSPEANAGSVVVINNHTNSVLAAANYPTYDMETYTNDYSSLLEADGNPLFNRAFMGTYEPGSTFKPATALIGLQTGAITLYDEIFCAKKYTYYKDFQPSCLSRHGNLNVVSAITYSCNYFFFEVGRRAGIENLNKFCTLMGFGQKTGVEIEESSGILAGPAYRESKNAIWNPGDTIQASIGQSDNLFTPLQMGVYISTIVNNGTRYRAHLVDSVYSYDLSQMLEVATPDVLSYTGINEEYYKYVKQGMHSVSTDGTVSKIFARYKINIGGKTGTAQVSYNGKRYDNALFVSFAPYENPEISVVVIIEKGGYGSYVAQVAKDIYDYYFSYRGETYVPQKSNVLV